MPTTSVSVPAASATPGADAPVQALLVDVAGTRCALPLDAVQEILPAARVEPAPSAPRAVLGVLNLRGTAVVVVDVAVLLGRGGEELRPSDRFVVLEGTDPSIALRVRAAHDIAEVPVRFLAAGGRRGHPLEDLGVALLDDGLLVLLDPVTFVDAADHHELRRALADLEGA